MDEARPMVRRLQFKGICHDVLDTFASRNNDIGGYWALGLYRAFLESTEAQQLLLGLKAGTTSPEDLKFNASAIYYRDEISRMMDANGMPRNWFADGVVRFSIIGAETVRCEIEIVSDLGRIYRDSTIVTVRPHDPKREGRSSRYDGS